MRPTLLMCLKKSFCMLMICSYVFAANDIEKQVFVELRIRSLH
jgi:hypothetical protein